MFGSCSQPIRANNIILYGTRFSQHPIRTAATKGRQLKTCRSPRVPAVHANCLRAANLGFVLFGTRDSQHSIRTAAKTRRQLTTGRSPLVSAVHMNCLGIVNLLFVEEIIQNQKKLMYAINDPSSSRHMYPLGSYFSSRHCQAAVTPNHL